VSQPRLSAATLTVVGVGGAAGALLRWSLGEAFPDGSGWPWTTYAVNVVGCLLLGALPLAAARLGRRGVLAVGPGLLGGFTTFSAFADQSRALVASGQPGLALAHVAATVAACLLAALLGRRWAHARLDEEAEL
jgi:CrcB protein